MLKLESSATAIPSKLEVAIVIKWPYRMGCLGLYVIEFHLINEKEI